MARLNLNEMIGGKLKIKNRRSVINTFVFFQYIIATILVVSAFVIKNQINYMNNKPLGLSTDNVISIFLPEVSYGKINSFAETMAIELGGVQGVEHVSAVGNSFGYPWGDYQYLDNSGNLRHFDGNMVDDNFIPSLSLRILQGRNFDEFQYGDEDSHIIVNEALVKEYGWESPIGQHLAGKFGDHQVIGVVENFHYSSLHSAVQPCVLYKNDAFLRPGLEPTSYYRSFKSYLLLKLDGQDIPAALKVLEKRWEEASGGMNLTYSFIDEIVKSAYTTEQATSKLVNFITAMTLIIAATGLFGLITMKITSRSREISIRKVLGATSSQIIVNLSSDLMVIVLIANFLAIPVGYLLINNWLSNFYYHFHLQWWLLPLAGLFSLGIAAIVMVVQTWRISTTNPADVLRTE